MNASFTIAAHVSIDKLESLVDICPHKGIFVSDGRLLFKSLSTAIQFVSWLSSAKVARPTLAISIGETSDEAIARAEKLFECTPLGHTAVCAACYILLTRKSYANFWFRAEGSVQFEDGIREKFYVRLKMDQKKPAYQTNEPSGGTQIPKPRQSFHGRSKELNELGELLSSHSMVTITGLTGMGKSVLSMVLARELESNYPDGIFWISVESFRYIEDLVAEIAKVTSATTPLGENLVSRIAESIGSMEMLIILDHCDHLALELGKVCDELLKESVSFSLLLTSSKATHANQEQIYELKGLSFTSIESNHLDSDSSHSDAVELFYRRAKQHRSSFRISKKSLALMNQICEDLDGIPKVIEIVASRLRTYSLVWIHKNLKLALLQPAQNPLEAASAWTIDDITPEERRILNKISFFRDSFSLETYQAIWLDDPDQDEISDLNLQILVDNSWIDLDPVTELYRMPAPIRFHIESELSKDQSLLQSLSCQFVRGIVKRTRESVELLNLDYRISSDFISEHHEDIAHAINTAIEIPGLRSEIVSLLTEIIHFWVRREDQDRTEEWIKQLLQNEKDIEPQSLVKLLNIYGGILLVRTEYARSFELYKRAFDIADQHKSEPARSVILGNMAMIRMEQGLFEESMMMFEEAIETVQQYGSPRHRIPVFCNYIFTINSAVEQNHLSLSENIVDRIEFLLVQLHTMAETNRDPHMLQKYHCAYGHFRSIQGRTDEAKEALVTAIQICMENDMPHEATGPLEDLAWLLTDTDPIRSARVLGFSTSIRVTTGTQRYAGIQIKFNKIVNKLRSSLGKKSLDAELESGFLEKYSSLINFKFLP
jgi:non-specific serine/threonine protein kinase